MARERGFPPRVPERPAPSSETAPDQTVPVPSVGGRWLERLLVGLSFLVFFCLVLWMIRLWRPAERVTVRVENVPSNVRFLCLLVEDGNGPRLLRWSLRDWFPYTLDPADSLEGVVDRRHEESSVERRVLWQDGDRYGVLVQYDDGRWLLWRLGRQDAEVRGRYPIVGGGTVTLSLPDPGFAERPSDDFLRKLGLNPARPPRITR